MEVVEPYGKRKVSIVLPVRDPGPVIDRCIASLRGQTLKEIEMIFVDDLGTDDSMAKVWAAAVEDPRIRVVVNPENIGPGPSRNAGIETARGDYLLFADPDDYIDLTFLEELYREASAKDLDIVKGSFVGELADGSRVYRTDLNEKIIDGLAEGKPLYTLLKYQHQSVLVRRSVLLNGHIRYGTSRYGQDTTFLLRLCCADVSFGVCRTTGAYHYVYRELSGMNRWSKQTLTGRLDEFREKVAFLLSREFDRSAEEYVLECVGYLLWVHSGASVTPGLKEASAVFLSELREQVLRCPLSEKAVNSDMKIRGLVVYGKNLVQTPYRFYLIKPGIREYLCIFWRWFDFLCGHPREIPAVFGDLVRTVKKKLASSFG